MVNSLYKDSFLLKGLMCSEYCGSYLQRYCDQTFSAQGFPPETEPCYHLEAVDEECYRFFISLKHHGDVTKEQFDTFILELKKSGFTILSDESMSMEGLPGYFNLVINAVTLGLMICLTIAFPSSIGLTVGLTLLSVVSTTLTARHYLRAFIREALHGQFSLMPTSVSMGWLFSLAHALFHVWMMPMHGSMVLVGMMMPVLLMACINGMDEIKRQMQQYTKHLKGEYIKKTTAGCAERYQQVNGDWVEKEALKKGMQLFIEKQMTVPVDSILMSEKAYFDTTSITGETHQVKRKGESIISGSVHLGDRVEICVQDNLYNSHITRLMLDSNRRKKYASVLPSFIHAYTIGLLVGLSISVMIPVVLGHFSLLMMTEQVISILFSICPCTLLMAHEFSKAIVMHQLLNKGIYVADKSVLERKLPDTIIFDKTGTLTETHPVADLSACDESIQDDVILLEQEAYTQSYHPIAYAIAAHKTDLVMTQPMSDFKRSSQGVSARIGNKMLYLGNQEYMNTLGCSPARGDITRVGQTAIFVAQQVDGEALESKGVIYIQHAIKKESRSVVKAFKENKKTLVMLTGDEPGVAEHVNGLFDGSFASIFSKQTPTQKKQTIETHWTESVAYIGDGANDAPAFHAARDKGGIAISVGEGASRSPADLVLQDMRYLLVHDRLCDLIADNTTQNQWILAGSALLFFGYSWLGLMGGCAISPFLPMMTMLLTTAVILLNAYRIQYSVDTLVESPSCSYPLHQ